MGKSAGGVGGGTNVYDQSAASLAGAGNLIGGAAGVYGGVGDVGNPRNVHGIAMPGRIANGMDAYMNPWTDQVIKRTRTDIDRSRMGQLDDIAAKASSVGAFGGSRMGVVEALTNSEAQKNMGDIAAQLRSEGFNTAAGLSAQDIANKMQAKQFNRGIAFQNIGNNMDAKKFDIGTDLARAAGLGTLADKAMGLGTTQFGVGQALDQQQMQQGSLQQALLQSIMSGASGQFSDFLNRPKNLLDMKVGALGMNPMNNATTTTQTNTPGLFDYLSLAAQTYGAMP